MRVSIAIEGLDVPGILQARHELDLTKLDRLKTAGGRQLRAEGQEVLGGHRLEHGHLLHQQVLDHLDARERVARRAQLLRLYGTAHPLQFVDQHLEPELVDLMDHDEEQLVVGLGQPLLQLEQRGNVQVGVVAEPAARRVLVAHPAKAVWSTLLLRFSGRCPAGSSLVQKSVTTSPNKGGDACRNHPTGTPGTRPCRATRSRRCRSASSKTWWPGPRTVFPGRRSGSRPPV